MKTTFISFLILFVISLNLYSQETKTLNIGDKVPYFETLADDGSTWNINNFIGKKYVVVYFYPAAMTGGCTKQACAYRDFKSDIESADAVVVGVSGDNIEGLKLFKKAENLNFTLLSDVSGKISKSFGVPTRDGGTITREIDGKTFDLVRGTTANRWTFIVDKEGNIAYKNEQVDATKDTEEVLNFIKKINKKQ